MPTRAEAIPEWRIGNYVFVDAGVILGRAASVGGLDEAVQFAAHPDPLKGFPDLRVAAMDPDLERWAAERRKNPGEKWDFAIRDNRRHRWVGVRGAFVHYWNGAGACTWAINGVEPGAET